MSGDGKSYRSGIVFALITAALYSTQEPFFGEAARQLSATAFIGLTQVALLLAVPLMLARRKSRTDFVAIFRNRALYGKLAGILALGVATIFCLIFGLRGANPIVVAAILNLSPFWAALIAKFVSGNKIPISPALFFSCFVAAFVGAALIAFSQNGAGWADILKGFGQATWLLALPLPVLAALSGTLVGEWFGDYEEFAAIAANFLLSACVVIPGAVVVAWFSGTSGLAHATWLSVALLVVGNITSAAIGRVTYQIALTATHNDNGFVSMFLLLVPALTALVTLPLSWLIPDLRFEANAEFFAGLGVVSVSLLFFSIQAWRAQAAGSGG